MDGVYRVYKLRHLEGGMEKHLAARFLIHEGAITHLEDHTGVLASMFPEGPVSENAEARLDLHNGYTQVINEDDLNAGHHPEHIPDFDTGISLPDAIFAMITPDGQQMKLVVHGNVVEVNGRRLNEAETNDILQAIENGQVQLQEIAPQTPPPEEPQNA